MTKIKNAGDAFEITPLPQDAASEVLVKDPETGAMKKVPVGDLRQSQIEADEQLALALQQVDPESGNASAQRSRAITEHNRRMTVRHPSTASKCCWFFTALFLMLVALNLMFMAYRAHILSHNSMRVRYDEKGEATEIDFTPESDPKVDASPDENLARAETAPAPETTEEAPQEPLDTVKASEAPKEVSETKQSPMKRLAESQGEPVPATPQAPVSQTPKSECCGCSPKTITRTVVATRYVTRHRFYVVPVQKKVYVLDSGAQITAHKKGLLKGLILGGALVISGSQLYIEEIIACVIIAFGIVWILRKYCQKQLQAMSAY